MLLTFYRFINNLGVDFTMIVDIKKLTVFYSWILTRQVFHATFSSYLQNILNRPFYEDRLVSDKFDRCTGFQARFANIPVVLTIPEPFATSEPTKIAAATSTIQPDWAMSNWYEMKIPETVADTAKHIESIIVFLKERA